MAKRVPVVVGCAPRTDGFLSVVEVSEGQCVLSTGEVLLVKWGKLRALCEQACQERSAIWIRTWTTKDGNELIELHRVESTGVTSTSGFTGTPSAPSEAF